VAEAATVAAEVSAVAEASAAVVAVSGAVAPPVAGKSFQASTDTPWRY